MVKSIIKIVASLAVIIVICFLALYGVDFNKDYRIPGVLDPDGIRQGLDLKGGSVIVYQATKENPTDEEMKSAANVLRARLDALGYTEATVTQQGSNKIRLEIPSLLNPNEAAEKLGATAQLKFVDYAGEEVLSGEHIESASAEFGTTNKSPNKKEYYVKLVLTDEGSAMFKEATTRVSQMKADKNNYIAIMLDEDVVSAPTVENSIDTKECIIEGVFEQDYATYLAGVIKSGRLKVGLEKVELRTVGATLGEKALSTSVMAGIIGIILVFLFMLFMYRLPGLIADIALLFYIGVIGVILANFHINLTLPGIAGIILSVGMAVDANVIIFERIKEELRLGKTVRASVDAGFHRAMSSIIDSNITTIISAAILAWLGTGPIKGFGVTLLIGVIVSMFSAIVVTKFLLKLMVGINLKQLWLYGVKPKKKEVSANV